MIGPVDLVVPFVNPNDQEWQQLYKYCSGISEIGERFRDFSVLKFMFRSINRYAPFIRLVHLILASESQIPNWLNTKNSRLNIVYHKNFIPEKYLPTFNSNTIEMFLSNIQNVSEHFLYGNDDLLFMKRVDVSDFFTEEGLPKIAYTSRYKQNPSGFLSTCKRSWLLIEEVYGRDKVEMEMGPEGQIPAFIKQHHGSAVPRLMSSERECFLRFNNEIIQSLTMFRNMETNLNQYIFGNYLLATGNAVRDNADEAGTYYSKELNNLDDIENCTARMACINDTKEMTIDDYIQVVNKLYKKFPVKSSFEN